MINVTREAGQEGLKTLLKLTSNKETQQEQNKRIAQEVSILISKNKIKGVFKGSLLHHKSKPLYSK